MKHSDYDYLTNAIEAVSAGAELLWMEQHPVDSPEKLDLPKVKRLMEKCANYPYVGLAPPLEERLPTPDTLPEWVEDKSRMALTCMRGVEDDFYKIHQHDNLLGLN